MKLKIVGLALLSAVLLPLSHAYAKEKTSSAEKRAIFSECHSSCVKNQNEDPETAKLFGDVPFVVENYCGCYCTRVAMRASKETLLKAGRMMAEGDTLGSDKPLKTELEAHGKVCLDAIFD